MLTTILGCETSQDCELYKNGEFFTYDPITKNKINVERKDSVQIESDPANGSVQRSKIFWKNPCEYHLVGIFNSKSNLDDIDSFWMLDAGYRILYDNFHQG